MQDKLQDKLPFHNVQSRARRIRLAAIILLLGAAGCSSSPSLKGFDRESWARDERSCQNIRPKLLPQLEKVQQEFLGLGHTEVIRLLGKPEGKSMEKSGQRAFYYYVEAGPQCQDKNLYTQANKLVLRFDVLDRVNLVTFRK